MAMAKKAGYSSIEEYRKILTSSTSATNTPVKVAANTSATTNVTPKIAPKKVKTMQVIKVPVGFPKKNTAMSRTDMTNLIDANQNKILSVTFFKQLKKSEIKKKITALYPNEGGKLKSKDEFTKNVNKLIGEALNGEKRELIGTYKGEKDRFGRFIFEENGQLRLVDPRTLHIVKCNGVTVSLKK